MSSEPRKKNTAINPLKAILGWVRSGERITIYLQDYSNMVIEGVIIGTDQFMSLVLDHACEVNLKQGTRKELGRIMLKGESISMITTPQHQ